MSDIDVNEDRRLVELYRKLARERSAPECDVAVLRFARTRARRSRVFRHIVVPAAAAAMVLLAFVTWRVHRDDARDAADARAHRAATVADYLLTLQLGVTPTPSRITQYLIGLQPDDMAAARAVDQIKSSQ